jgi:SAM-dependent methyltransferase
MIYNTLANYYDALVKDEEASRQWVEWIQSKSEACSCLELACGSGEITEMLANLNYKVTALDLSQEMVKRAKEKNVEQNIEFLCQDMRDLSNLGDFHIILCLCDSFNYLLDKDDVKKFFHEVYLHLNQGGRFFFDTHALDRLEEFSQEYNETGEFEDGCKYQWSIMSEDDYVYQDFAFYTKQGVIQEHHIQRVYDPKWLEKELSAYFEIESVCTDFGLERICEGEKYFYICRKKENV